MTSDAPHEHQTHGDHADHQTLAAPAGASGAPSAPERRVTLTIPTGPVNSAAREKSVEDALKSIPGVTRVHMHPKDGYAHVTVGDGTSERDLRAVALAAGGSDEGSSHSNG